MARPRKPRVWDDFDPDDYKERFGDLNGQDYARAYERGWKRSQGFARVPDGGNIDRYSRESNPFGKDDPRSDAWEDGYGDYSVERPKWSTPFMGWKRIDSDEDWYPDYLKKRVKTDPSVYDSYPEYKETDSGESRTAKRIDKDGFCRVCGYRPDEPGHIYGCDE